MASKEYPSFLTSFRAYVNNSEIKQIYVSILSKTQDLPEKEIMLHKNVAFPCLWDSEIVSIESESECYYVYFEFHGMKCQSVTTHKFPVLQCCNQRVLLAEDADDKFTGGKTHFRQLLNDVEDESQLDYAYIDVRILVLMGLLSNEQLIKECLEAYEKSVLDPPKYAFILIIIGECPTYKTFLERIDKKLACRLLKSAQTIYMKDFLTSDVLHILYELLRILQPNSTVQTLISYLATFLSFNDLVNCLDNIKSPVNDDFAQLASFDEKCFCYMVMEMCHRSSTQLDKLRFIADTFLQFGHHLRSVITEQHGEEPAVVTQMIEFRKLICDTIYWKVSSIDSEEGLENLLNDICKVGYILLMHKDHLIDFLILKLPYQCSWFNNADAIFTILQQIQAYYFLDDEAIIGEWIAGLHGVCTTAKAKYRLPEELKDVTEISTVERQHLLQYLFVFISDAYLEIGQKIIDTIVKIELSAEKGQFGLPEKRVNKENHGICDVRHEVPRGNRRRVVTFRDQSEDKSEEMAMESLTDSDVMTSGCSTTVIKDVTDITTESADGDGGTGGSIKNVSIFGDGAQINYMSALGKHSKVFARCAIGTVIMNAWKRRENGKPEITSEMRDQIADQMNRQLIEQQLFVHQRLKAFCRERELEDRLETLKAKEREANNPLNKAKANFTKFAHHVTDVTKKKLSQFNNTAERNSDRRAPVSGNNEISLLSKNANDDIFSNPAAGNLDFYLKKIAGDK